MKMHERYKNFPVNFYQDEDKVTYESNFTQGEAESLNAALKKFATSEFIDDLFYYYDDVSDVQIGTYIPAIRDRKRKGKLFLGKLDIKVDILPTPSKTSITYLSKHKEEIPNHLEWMEKMKKDKKKEELKQKIVNGIKKFYTKVRDMLQGKNFVYEMFDPIKATTDHICEHCGLIIPTASYYDTYRGKDYHIECLWDKLINKLPENNYEEARNFFFSLEKYKGNWPAYGYDVEEDYLSDLELVKHNKRSSIHETFEYYERKCF